MLLEEAYQSSVCLGTAAGEPCCFRLHCNATTLSISSSLGICVSPDGGVSLRSLLISRGGDSIVDVLADALSSLLVGYTSPPAEVVAVGLAGEACGANNKAGSPACRCVEKHGMINSEVARSSLRFLELRRGVADEYEVGDVASFVRLCGLSASVASAIAARALRPHDGDGDLPTLMRRLDDERRRRGGQIRRRRRNHDKVCVCLYFFFWIWIW